MKRPRTVFAPFALVAVAAIGVGMLALSQAPSRADLVSKAILADGAKRVVLAASPTPAQNTRLRLAPAGGLIVPVSALSTDALVDTWGAARSEGRAHKGIDIMAPFGAPVLAAADGRIARFWDSERGGVTIYQFDENEQVVYYYAHLASRAEGLEEGQRVRQGDVIGYVGMSGNATTPHLHFEIQRIANPRRWWTAEAVNPYPYLLAGEAPN